MSEKTLDNNFEVENSSVSLDLIKKPFSKKGAPKKGAPKNEVTPDSSPAEDKSLYTVDPITGEKYLKPSGDTLSLGQRNFRIPTINRPGFVTIWEITRGNAIANRIAEGWDFADPNTPGNEKAKETPYGGTDQTSKALFHRALQMPIEKYEAMMRARGERNDAREKEIIFNVKAGVSPADQKDFKVQKENNLGQVREMAPAYTSSGMSSGEQNGYSSSMR